MLKENSLFLEVMYDYLHHSQTCINEIQCEVQEGWQGYPAVILFSSNQLNNKMIFFLRTVVRKAVLCVIGIMSKILVLISGCV